MGNHHAGRAMGHAANAVLRTKKRFTKAQALKVLDDICKPWKGCDAEFEAEDPKRPNYTHPEYGQYTDPQAALGKLIAIALGKPDHDYVQEFERELEASGEDSSWFDGPYEKFRKRYRFC